jgi:hypothetical protein
VSVGDLDGEYQAREHEKPRSRAISTAAALGSYSRRMGIDFEIVVYRGKPVPVGRLAELIARHTPYAELFRHAIAAEVKSPIEGDLHMIAFYDDQGGGPDDDMDAGDADSDAQPAKTELVIPDSELATARESLANGGSLADVMQQAWSLAGGAIHDMPAQPASGTEAQPGSETEPSCAELARELSRGGEAFLLGYGDHSCTGTYAHFRDGELVFPASIEEICDEHEDYIAWPSEQWSHALGKTVDLDNIVARYFPDASTPPLCRVERPNQPIPFDSDRYSIGISESM